MGAETAKKPGAKINHAVKLRPARPEDVHFSWVVYAEAVRPHIEPHIATRFKREWSDDYEKAGFMKWWTPENTSIITLADKQVGWLHFQESDEEIILVNYSVASEFHRQGIGSTVLELLLRDWAGKGKPIVHSVLKGSPHKGFFERRGFQVVGDEDIAHRMRRPPAVSKT